VGIFKITFKEDTGGVRRRGGRKHREGGEGRKKGPKISMVLGRVRNRGEINSEQAGCLGGDPVTLIRNRRSLKKKSAQNEKTRDLEVVLYQLSKGGVRSQSRT